MAQHKVNYEVRVTFEDGTAINFTGEGITEIQFNPEKTLRHKHSRVVNQIVDIFREYIKLA